MSRTPTCSNHCAECDTCFSSLVAFDRHRTGSFKDPADPRRCEIPDVGDYEFVEGECRIMEFDDLGRPVPKASRIWTVRGSRERGRKVRQSYDGSPSSAQASDSYLTIPEVE